MILFRRWSCILAGGLLCAACGDDGFSPRAVRLAFVTQPTNTAAGVAIDPVVAVAIEDASGNTVAGATNVVTLAIGTSGGRTSISGTTSAASVAGVASFPDIRIDRADSGYTLTASAKGLAGATSAPFTISSGSAGQLVFVVQPRSAMGGVPITPPVQVAAQDSFGNLVTDFRESVTVALGGNAAPGTLSGTTVVRAVNGVTTYNDLSIARVSAGYTLLATAGTLGAATSAPFAIIKPTGSLRISAATSGSSLDPDGYAVCVDPASDGHGGTSCGYGGSVAIQVNGAVTVAVDTGAHVALLAGIAANCTVAGDNPRAVATSPGQVTEARFAVACAPPVLHITTATSGQSLDPDGYSVCVDPYEDYEGGAECSYSSAIGVNSGVSVPVASGTHVVELDGAAANCAVGGDNPRSVAAGAPSEVAFAVTCFATGSVRVRTVTSGTDAHPDGYQVCIDYANATCYWSAQAGANDEITMNGVFAGSHTVTLTRIGGNCTVSQGTARTVTVPDDATADVGFDASCALAERIAYSSNGAILVIHTDGTANHSIAGGSAPTWSPDGSRLAYECGQDICATNADGTGFQRLTFDGAGNRHPSWAPDGSKIAFAAPHAGATDLYVMAANGSEVVRLTQGVGVVGSPAWSPDGTKIAFDCRVDAGNDDICAVHADGTGFTRLTTNSARDYSAAWKPDGSTLAFATTRYGTVEIVLMSPAGGSVTRIGAGLLGFAPTWSPDGTQVAFVVREGDCADYECNPYDAIFTAHTDGSNLHYISDGDQPAWKPHQ